MLFGFAVIVGKSKVPRVQKAIKGFTKRTRKNIFDIVFSNTEIFLFSPNLMTSKGPASSM